MKNYLLILLIALTSLDVFAKCETVWNSDERVYEYICYDETGENKPAPGEPEKETKTDDSSNCRTVWDWDKKAYIYICT